MSAALQARSRLPWLLAFLSLAAILVATDKRESEVVSPVARTDSGPSAPRGPAAGATAVPRAVAAASPTAGATGVPVGRDGSAPLMILALRPRQSGLKAPDMFAVRNWNPPPPPVAGPPAKPVPPAFAYIVLGKQFIDGRWEVFLGLRERTLVVREGDAIDGQFRIERIAPPAMTLVVLGFDERRTVAIGAAE